MDWLKNHPVITMWLLLSIGMVVILTFVARDVGLLPSQWFWLIVMTIGVAGLCAWIVSWGESDEEID